MTNIQEQAEKRWPYAIATGSNGLTNSDVYEYNIQMDLLRAAFIAGASLQGNGAGVWVKASVKLPTDLSNTKKYFCKFYMLGSLVREDMATGAFINSVKDSLRPLEGDEVKYSGFNEIEYLDESAALSGWISVEDGLPDFDVKVLVMGEGKGMNPQMGGAYISIARRQDLSKTSMAKDASRYQDKNQFSSMNYVTHWRYLPTPPQSNTKG